MTEHGTSQSNVNSICALDVPAGFDSAFSFLSSAWYTNLIESLCSDKRLRTVFVCLMFDGGRASWTIVEQRCEYPHGFVDVRKKKT